MKMFEYMASGKPIISSRLPVLMEVLNHEHNALLAGPDVASEWVLAVTLLKENRQLGERLAAKAREDVMNYTWEERAGSVLKHWGIT
jgi:glycosyltransferase involved in cell wall biosynthesis